MAARRALYQQITDDDFRSKNSTTSSSHHDSESQALGRQLERESMQSLADDIVSPFFIIGRQWQKNLTRLGTVTFLRPGSN